MSGNLRDDLFSDLLVCEREADLVLAVGTSLCGMNADRVVSSAAARARREGDKKSGDKSGDKSGAQHLGSVIVSLQRTVHDANSSLRIFALIDDVLSLLAEELECPLPPADPKPLAAQGKDEDQVFRVPYDPKTGLRLSQASPPGGSPATASCCFNPTGAAQPGGVELATLDLRPGALLTISSGPDKGAKAEVLGRNRDGHFRISVQRRFKSGGKFNSTFLLGAWWPEEAARGEVDYIPIVPRIEGPVERADEATE